MNKPKVMLMSKQNKYKFNKRMKMADSILTLTRFNLIRMIWTIIN